MSGRCEIPGHTQKKKWWKRKRTVALLIVILLLLSLIPLPIREQDKITIVEKSVRSLLDRDRVLIWTPNKGPAYCTFPNIDFFDGTQTYLYENDIGLDNNIFKSLNLKKYSDELEGKSFDEMNDFYENNRLITFNHEDLSGAADDDIHFGYCFGPLGGSGFRVVAYRNIWGCFVVYVFEWVS